MDDFRLQLSLLDGRVGLMGIGNIEQGDDGFGVRLAEQLSRDGLPNVILAGTEPELFLGRCAGGGLNHLVFLDAVEFGGAPGSVVFLDSGQIQAKFAQISTHKLSLGLLAKCVEAGGSTRAWLLGAQPETLHHSSLLSPIMHRTVSILAELIGAQIGGEAAV